MELFFFSTFGKAFIPKKFRPHLRTFFEKTGRDDVPYHAFGILFWIATAITYGIYITRLFEFLSDHGPIAFFFGTLLAWTGIMLIVVFVITAAAYFYLSLQIFHRTKEMESKLADYLMLVSTNLKGGYSFEKALWSAIKPEFGILAKEIGLVSKKVATGNDVGDALDEFAMKYDSPILRRAMALIIGEVESGGKVVDVIDRVITDLKKTKALKEEMAASTLTYMIFIAALVMFVMPVLFALSFILFSIITGFVQSLSGTTAVGPLSKLTVGKAGVDPDDYKMFAVLAIIIISSSSAMIVSIIEKGDIKSGVKYIPLFVLTSVSLYFLFIKVLGSIFGGITMGG